VTSVYKLIYVKGFAKKRIESDPKCKRGPSPLGFFPSSETNPFHSIIIRSTNMISNFSFCHMVHLALVRPGKITIRFPLKRVLYAVEATVFAK
jgi:hypothetical protein